jgi:hypothetical protein
MEALPLVGGLISGIGGYLGAGRAADASRHAADLQNQRWQQAYSDSAPYRTGGTNALNQYNTAMGLNGTENQQQWASGLSSDPAFAASTRYGLDSAQARFAAQGMGLSGNERAALSDYSQKNLLGYEQQTLDNLFREGSLGAGVTNQSMASSTSSAANQGNALIQAGNAEGQQYTALANGMTGGLKNYYYGSAGTGGTLPAGSSAVSASPVYTR